MRIAAFDLGANIAVAHNGFGPDCPRVSSAVFKGDRVTRAGATLLWLWEFFATAEAQFGGFDAVLYERPFARGKDATRCLWGIAGLVEAVGTAAGAAVTDATPSEIKKFTTGDGSADKDAMTFSAMMTGYLGDNEHEADAWCALRFAEATLVSTPPKPKKVKKK